MQAGERKSISGKKGESEIPSRARPRTRSFKGTEYIGARQPAVYGVSRKVLEVKYRSE